MTTHLDVPAGSSLGAVADAFLRDLAGLLRAGDPYGRFDRFPEEHLLRPFVVDSAARARIAVNCDVDALTVERLRSFYQAVAAGAERALGTLTAVLVDINHEGFGMACVYAGRLILVADPLRDVQRFGFPDTGALAAAGENRIERAVRAYAQFPEVARADA